MYAIDTNIFIGFLRGTSPDLYERFKQSDASFYIVPSVVRAELLVGAEKSSQPEIERLKIESMLLPFKEVPFDTECAFQYAQIRAFLEKKGRTIGANDYLIAATAMAHNAILVTNNSKEFKRIPGLAVEEWAMIDF